MTCVVNSCNKIVGMRISFYDVAVKTDGSKGYTLNLTLPQRVQKLVVNLLISHIDY